MMQMYNELLPNVNVLYFWLAVVIMSMMLQTVFEYYLSATVIKSKLLTILTAPFITVYIYEPELQALPNSLEIMFGIFFVITLLIGKVTIFNDKEIE